MAPHHAVDNHHSAVPAKAPAPLSVTKGNNAGKPTPGAPHKRDLQSAMQNAPQVRVIHIFAPKVIKTDVANFRATVQKLTGRSKRRAPRAAKAVAVTCSANVMAQGNVGAATQGGGPSSPMGYPVGLWEKEELQRLVGDACGVTHHLVRCDSVDSGTYSLDSANTVFSGDSSGVDTSPTSDGGFSFYPQRETPYSLSEIPAPFFGLPPHDVMMHSVFSPMTSVSMPSPSTPMLLPEPVLLGSLPTDHQNMSAMLGFDVEPIAQLPDVLPLGCTSISSSSSGGSLFDLPRQHCRLSVQQPYQGANFFESM